jgi:Leucine-rich repeat (LRR) protein
LTSISSGLFTQLTTLRDIDLSFNPITQLHPGAFPDQIVWMTIQHCQITELHPDAFKNLTSLEYLAISGNQITSLPAGVFSDLPRLWRLMLGPSRIQRLNSNSFGRHEFLNTISIPSSGLDEIQPGFFNSESFPILYNFNALNNSCVNVSLTQVNSIDFEENLVLNKCFSHWYWPRETTTEPSVDDSGSALVASVILMVNVGLINLFVN